MKLVKSLLTIILLSLVIRAYAASNPAEEESALTFPKIEQAARIKKFTEERLVFQSKVQSASSWQELNSLGIEILSVLPFDVSQAIDLAENIYPMNKKSLENDENFILTKKRLCKYIEERCEYINTSPSTFFEEKDNRINSILKNFTTFDKNFTSFAAFGEHEEISLLHGGGVEYILDFLNGRNPGYELESSYQVEGKEQYPFGIQVHPYIGREKDIIIGRTLHYALNRSPRRMDYPAIFKAKINRKFLEAAPGQGEAGVRQISVPYLKDVEILLIGSPEFEMAYKKMVPKGGRAHKGNLEYSAHEYELARLRLSHIPSEVATYLQETLARFNAKSLKKPSRCSLL